MAEPLDITEQFITGLVDSDVSLDSIVLTYFLLNYIGDLLASNLTT